MADALTGAIVATRRLARGDRVACDASAIAPEPTEANRAILDATANRWREQAHRIADSSQAHRAYFAADTAFIASRELGRDPDTRIRVITCGPVILGLALYRFETFPYPRFYIGLVTVRPRDQPGYPGIAPRDRVRGVGRFLTEAVLDDISLEPACHPIELDCLDEAACAYWRHIGFHNTTEPLTLRCDEAREIAAGLFPTPADDPVEYVQAGARQRVAAVNALWE